MILHSYKATPFISILWLCISSSSKGCMPAWIFIECKSYCHASSPLSCHSHPSGWGVPRAWSVMSVLYDCTGSNSHLYDAADLRFKTKTLPKSPHMKSASLLSSSITVVNFRRGHFTSDDKAPHSFTWFLAFSYCPVWKVTSNHSCSELRNLIFGLLTTYKSITICSSPLQIAALVIAFNGPSLSLVIGCHCEPQQKSCLWIFLLV